MNSKAHPQNGLVSFGKRLIHLRGSTDAVVSTGAVIALTVYKYYEFRLRFQFGTGPDCSFDQCPGPPSFFPVFTLYSFASREIITNRLGLYFTYARRALSTVSLLNFFSGDGASSRLFVDGYDT